jgi:lipopolysaccharide transport system ATP-binding protein
MSDIAIRVEGLGKKYRLGATQQSYYSLRDALAGAAAVPLQLARRLIGRSSVNDRNGRPEFWALKDVGFNVKHGEVLGIVGRNGAGKSTLLKLLSEITEPTAGRITLNGRVASLLEVGTGFHPELTGRENVLLNGAILGMSKSEIARKFDEIVAFAEVEQFIDTQVKHYSSGMYLRLAFAVAAHLEPEILIIDEVLAVGDAAFQKKCLGRMSEVAGEGRTVLFVSHNMGAVQGLCSRALWLENGQTKASGRAADIVSKYLNDVFDQGLGSNKVDSSSDHLQLTKVSFTDLHGEMASCFSPGDGLRIEIHYFAPKRFERPVFIIYFDSQFGSILSANMQLDGRCPDYIEGEGTLVCSFRSLPLLPQSYGVHLAVRAKDGVAPLTSSAAYMDIGYFQIFGRMADYGFHGERADVLVAESAPVIIPYEWHFPDGSIASVNGFVTEV